jgi:hypothetical protein
MNFIIAGRIYNFYFCKLFFSVYFNILKYFTKIRNKNRPKNFLAIIILLGLEHTGETIFPPLKMIFFHLSDAWIPIRIAILGWIRIRKKIDCRSATMLKVRWVICGMDG